MYQLGTKWKLWDLPSVFQRDVEAITLRGYGTEPERIVDELTLPAELYWASVDDKGTFRGLSVEAITSRYCPTWRDLYLEKKQGSRGSKGHSTWGRIAGHLIEEYCIGLLTHFRELAQLPDGLDYQRIQSLAEEYSQVFWRTHITSLQKLRDKAGIPEEAPERLVFLLQQTAKYELTMLGIDYAFTQNVDREFVPLTKGVPVISDKEITQIHPGTNLGLSKVTIPDFVILKPTNVVMGDVKTGDHLKPFHLDTIAGYALAYESQHKEDVSFGIVYFFETHARQMNFAQSYVFVIDDSLRRSFLRKRNDAYGTLQRSEPPPLADDYEKYCQYCKHLADCYPDSDD